MIAPTSPRDESVVEFTLRAALAGIGFGSSSLATGTIFTIPALFLWGIIPPYWQIVGLAFLGALLGITAIVPLRRLLIVQSAAELPYPEGTACAEVLRATAAEASGGRWIFLGLAIALLVAAKRTRPDSGWSRWLDAAHFAGKDFAWIPRAAGVVVGIGLVLVVAGVLWRARGREAIKS